MNRHGIYTEKKVISFLSFKGAAKQSTLDQVTLPPETGLGGNMFHKFGEWLKREGHDWQFLPEEKLCRLAVDFFNLSLTPKESPRRFDSMIPNP